MTSPKISMLSLVTTEAVRKVTGKGIRELWTVTIWWGRRGLLGSRTLVGWTPSIQDGISLCSKRMAARRIGRGYDVPVHRGLGPQAESP